MIQSQNDGLLRWRKRSGICLCLPPDWTWHKVTDTNVDLKWELQEGKVGLESRLELSWTLLVIGSLNAMEA